MSLFGLLVTAQGRWHRRLLCDWCHQLFVVPGARAQLYCSRRCSNSAWRARRKAGDVETAPTEPEER